jgi:two-component system, LytTR family, response regulator
MKLRTVIVDDEALARNRLRKFLVEEPDLEIIGECSNGHDAIRVIREQKPQLIFLDVQMPEVSGFDVLRGVPAEQLGVVIFVTAFDRHAVEAFEVRALDYLLKPFTRDRLRQALARARNHLRPPALAALQQQLQDLFKTPEAETNQRTRIAVRNGNQVAFIKVIDIDYIESAANYAVLHTRAGNHVVRETLTNLESSLSPKAFLRISRSTIVNLDRVKGLQTNSVGEYVAILHDNRQLSMTRGLREVQERLEYA